MEKKTDDLSKYKQRNDRKQRAAVKKTIFKLEKWRESTVSDETRSKGGRATKGLTN